MAGRKDAGKEVRSPTGRVAVSLEVSVVIVNYNAGNDLDLCVESLETGLAPMTWNGVIIDNASSDGSAKRHAGSARFVVQTNPTNVGFGRGVNQGVSMTCSRYVLILNPDCVLTPGSVAALRNVLDQDRECVLVGPRVTDRDGTLQGSARGDPAMLTGLFGRATHLTHWFPRSRLAQHNVRSRAQIESGASSGQVDWVAGVCMLTRRDAFEQVGGFDERFFLYWEDADLCRRLRARGGVIRFVSGATVSHRVGRSSRTAEAVAIRSFHDSAYLYYTTHVAPSSLDPARWVAKVALGLRCRWHLSRAQARRRGTSRRS